VNARATLWLATEAAESGGGNALSDEAKIALGVVGVATLVVVFVFVSAMRDRRSAQSIPANLKPYLDDEELESSSLERTLSAAVYSVFACALFIGFYFVTEPARQQDMFDEFELRSVERGAIGFGPATDAEGHSIPGAFDCQSCHSAGGAGGSTSYTITDPATGDLRVVTWEVPSLNDVLLRFSEESVRTIVVYGRPGTPMSGWGLAGGGAMNEAQVEDVLSYLASIQVDEGTAREKYTDSAMNRLGLLQDLPEFADTEADALMGQALFDVNCARCHTPGYSYTAPGEKHELPAGAGSFGPSLITVQAQFPDTRQPILERSREVARDGTVTFLDAEGKPVTSADEAALVPKLFSFTKEERDANGKLTQRLVRDQNYFPVQVQRFVPIPTASAEGSLPVPPFWWEEMNKKGDPKWFTDEGMPLYPTLEDTENVEKYEYKLLGGEDRGVYSQEISGTNFRYLPQTSLLVIDDESGEAVVDADDYPGPTSVHEMSDGLLAQMSFISAGSIWQQPYGVRGIGQGRMPGFGRFLTQEQIRLISEYERSL